MSYRRSILKDAYKLYLEKGPNNAALADTLSSFKLGDQEYLAAMNALLTEKLLLGVEGPDKRVAVMANPAKIKEIERMLGKWYEDPKFWITTVVAVAAVVIALLTLLKP